MPRPGCDSQPQPAAQTAGHQVVDDVQAEPGAAAVAPGGEERLEGAPLHVLAHADAVVVELDLDMVGPALARRRAACVPARLSGKRMHQRVEHQVGQHLAVGPGVAVHRDFLRNVDRSARSASA